MIHIKKLSGSRDAGKSIMSRSVFDGSENWKINFNAVTRMKIIWYPYQVIRKLFPAKDVQQWNANRAQDKQLIYFREKLENPIESAISQARSYDFLSFL